MGETRAASRGEDTVARVEGRTCLVLGGTGFLGVHVALCAVRTGRSVVLASRGGPASLRRLSLPVPHALDGVDVREWDGRDARATRALLDAVAPNEVVLAAALARPHDCARDGRLARVLNGDLPQVVARHCAERGARLVHVSTDLVFGAVSPPPTGFREDDDVSPLTIYGRSKADGEVRVLDTAPDALVVRLPLLFGDSFGRGLGATDDIASAVARGEAPALFTDEWRTPLDVARAAEALLELAESSRAGLLHVAGSARLSRFELGRMLLSDRGASAAALVPVTRAERGMETERVRDASLDSSLARSFLRTDLSGPPGSG